MVPTEKERPELEMENDPDLAPVEGDEPATYEGTGIGAPLGKFAVRATPKKKEG